MSATNELDSVRALVEPIASDLDLDVYDIERRGSTVRITLDTPPGSDGGITLDNLALATRLISREIDHEDPISSRYTLEVTSPGLERQLRTPAHFQREVGKMITVRFRDPNADPRRVEGDLIAADELAATLQLADGTESTVKYGEIDKARTVFEWGPAPKPGGPKPGGPKPGGPKSGGKKSGGQKSGTKSGPKSKQKTTDQSSTQEKREKQNS